MKWLRVDVVLAMHKRQIAEHGGEAGIRDLGLLESALAWPQNTAHGSRFTSRGIERTKKDENL